MKIARPFLSKVHRNNMATTRNLFSFMNVADDIHVKMAVFWDVAPCSLVEIDRRFRGANYQHQGSLHSATSQKIVIFIVIAVIT
jgi:hypothetical protein